VTARIASRCSPISARSATKRRRSKLVLAPLATAISLRFFVPLRKLPPLLAARFTQIDYDREMALVAVAEIEGRKRQIGVARYVINRDERSCEFAIVVGDEAQNKGVGSRLMTALMQSAREHRLKVIEGEVLAENGPMLKLMADLGFSIRRSPADPAVCLVDHWL